MRVMLIRPPFMIDKEDFPFPFTEPIGLEYIASEIRDNHKVRIFDCVGEDWNKYFEVDDRLWYGSDVPRIISEIKEFKPEAIGISFLSYDLDILKSITKAIKNSFPSIKIILGGAYASSEKYDVLNNINYIDIVVYGEGEKTFKELLDKGLKELDNIKGIAFRKRATESDTISDIVLNEPREPLNLDELSFPARDLIPYKNYNRLIKYQILRQELGLFKRYKLPNIPLWLDDIFDFCFHMAVSVFIRTRNQFKKEKSTLLATPIGSILTSRSCPNVCNFCCSHNVFGRKFRMRSSENVLKEIDVLVKKYKVKQISFLDENITASKKRMMEICQGIIDRGYKLQLNNANGTFLPNLDEELLLKMKEAGYKSLAFGIETGNQYVMDNVVHKRQDLKKVKEIVALCRRIGFATTGFFVIGMGAGESISAMKDTIRFAKTTGFDKVQVYICQPLKGSPLYEEAKEKGWFTDDYNPKDAKMCRDRCFMNTPSWSHIEVEAIWKEAMKDKFFRYY